MLAETKIWLALNYGFNNVATAIINIAVVLVALLLGMVISTYIKTRAENDNIQTILTVLIYGGLAYGSYTLTEQQMAKWYEKRFDSLKIFDALTVNVNIKPYQQNELDCRIKFTGTESEFKSFMNECIK